MHGESSITNISKKRKVTTYLNKYMQTNRMKR